MNGSFTSTSDKSKFDSVVLPIILCFNQAVKGVSSLSVSVSFGSETKNDVVWRPISTTPSQAAQVWVANLSISDKELQSLDACSVEVKVGASKGILSSTACDYEHPSGFVFSVQAQALNTKHLSDLEKISWKDESFHPREHNNLDLNLIVPAGQLTTNNEHESTSSVWQAEIVAEEIEHFCDLLDYKIGKLTMARLLTVHDALMSSCKSVHTEETLRLYTKLMTLDPTHFGYYKDEHSLVTLRQLTKSRQTLLSRCFQYGDSASSTNGNPICLRLNDLSLSRLGSFERLLWVEMLDLSNNEIQSIEGLEALQLLSSLNLSRNKIGSFTSLAPLRQLKSLKVLDISYNNIALRSVDTTRCSSPLFNSAEVDLDFKEMMIDGLNEANYWKAGLVLKGLSLTQLDVAGNKITETIILFCSFWLRLCLH